MVLVAAFRLSAKDVEVYTLVILEMDGTNPMDSTPIEYQDLYKFSKKNSQSGVGSQNIIYEN